MKTHKMIFNSMDAIFRLAMVDPDLPDPETYKDRYYRRPVPMRRPASLMSESVTTAAATCLYEDFQVDYLIDPRSGQRVYYWRHCG